MKIILGSESKWRRELLSKVLPEFVPMAADIDEKAIRSDNYEELPMLLAHAKADALIPRIEGEALLITSDQVVVWNGELREKPESVEQARDYLRSYAQAPAQTNTAVVVTNLATGKRFEGIDISKTYYEEIPEEVISRLINEKDVMFTAGGFLLDEPLLDPYLIRIEGDKSGVIGLPIKLTMSLLAKAKA